MNSTFCNTFFPNLVISIVIINFFIIYSEELFMSLVNPIYLDINIQSQIQERFEQTSEINLPQFLLPDKFQSICDKLRSLEDWTLEGPPNRLFLQAKHLYILSGFGSYVRS